MSLSSKADGVLLASLNNRSVVREVTNALDFALANTTGTVYYVDDSGSDGTASGSQQKPFATIDYAIGQCTANIGDVIYVMPGHAEDITTATGINCDVAGVSIIGLGHGADVPTISFTAAAGSITVGAASVLLQNLKLVANFATGTTSGVTIAAAGDNCTLRGIKMRDTSAANEFLIHVSVATTVTDLTVDGCSFVSLAGTLSNSILFAGTTSDVVISNNTFFVDSSDSVVDHLVAAATNVTISNNILVNQDTGAAGYVLDFHASSTGIASYNKGAYNKVDAEMTKGAAIWWIQNLFSNTVAESGLLEPASSHAIP
jgi:hypothetical protein